MAHCHGVLLCIHLPDGTRGLKVRRLNSGFSVQESRERHSQCLLGGITKTLGAVVFRLSRLLANHHTIGTVRKVDGILATMAIDGGGEMVEIDQLRSRADPMFDERREITAGIRDGPVGMNHEL